MVEVAGMALDAGTGRVAFIPRMAVGDVRLQRSAVLSELRGRDVDPVSRAIAIRPWGIRGPLTWGDFERSREAMPAGASLDRPVEWVIQEPETFRYLLP